jgi:hypothetical protein
MHFIYLPLLNIVIQIRIQFVAQGAAADLLRDHCVEEEAAVEMLVRWIKSDGLDQYVTTLSFYRALSVPRWLGT